VRSQRNGFLWSVDFVFVIASTLQPLLQARGHAARPPDRSKPIAEVNDLTLVLASMSEKAL
jgi:hypothetical protein